MHTLFFLLMYTSLCDCILSVCRQLRRPEMVLDTPGAGIISGCELVRVGAGKCMGVLWKCSTEVLWKCSTEVLWKCSRDIPWKCS